MLRVTRILKPRGIMMKLQVVPVLVFITLVATIGCSGSGARRTMGRQCPLNYNPVPMDIPSNQKTNLDASLPSGTFDYQGAKLYYVDQASDFRMEISDLKKLNGDFEASITCVRNASPKTPVARCQPIGFGGPRIRLQPPPWFHHASCLPSF